MLKTTKTFIMLILAIISLLFPICVQASNVNMNLSNSSQFNSLGNALDTNSLSNVGNTSTYTGSNSTGASVYSQNPLDEGLGLANVLNIILAVIGVLLILLAIAIIIRLKR